MKCRSCGLTTAKLLNSGSCRICSASSSNSPGPRMSEDVIPHDRELSLARWSDDGSRPLLSRGDHEERADRLQEQHPGLQMGGNRSAWPAPGASAREDPLLQWRFDQPDVVNPDLPGPVHNEIQSHVVRVFPRLQEDRCLLRGPLPPSWERKRECERKTRSFPRGNCTTFRGMSVRSGCRCKAWPDR